MILFLNKMDILKSKVEANKFKIEDYFPEFMAYKPPPLEGAGNYHYYYLIIIKL